MSKSAPYQPLIFRLLHAAHGSLIVGAATTGFWLYNTWDQRFGTLPLPEADNAWLKIHHQIGTILTVFFVLFLIYSLIGGQRRLASPIALKQSFKLSGTRR